MLKDAIKQALKIVPKDKSKGAFQYVRFYNAGLPDNKGNKIYATDGTNFLVIYTDIKIPNCLIPANTLKQAIKAKGVGDITITEKGYGDLIIHNGVVDIPVTGRVFDEYPALVLRDDTISSLAFKIFDMDKSSKVFHATNDELAYVHFTPHYVEATDKARLARIEIENTFSGVLPVKLFLDWPKRSMVSVACTGAFTIFKIEDNRYSKKRFETEYRIFPLAGINYPDTENLIPEKHEGSFVIVDTDKLLEAVKNCGAFSELGLVHISLQHLEGSNDKTLLVTAWHKKAEIENVNSVIPITYCEITDKVSTALISAKYIEQALAEIETPSVKICLGESPISPLRLESSSLIECIWPMVG